MFCVVKELEALGLAKLLEHGGSEAVVEYFDFPGTDGRTTRTVPSVQVVPKKLGSNMRAYYLERTTGRWFVGRVIEDDDNSSVVRFTNSTDLHLPHADLFVRWRRPITDPTAFLAQGVTETPQFADARNGFLRSYISQRAAASGISALLSSAIELEPHQIDVVQRVLSDTHQRYLLADEVGLGKTIEAGVIIRQAVLDDPRTHRIVIVTPTSLTHQWRHELANRFGLGDFIDDSILILSADSETDIDAALDVATMLVVDEAHHLASLSDESASGIYDVVRRHCKHIDRLLLLSATPALRNETGFLRMLHLLDPATYRLEDDAAFRQRIAHRQSLAEAVATLDPQNVLSLDPVLDELLSNFPSDSRLQNLIGELKGQLSSLPDPEDPALESSILAVRTHLSETYRLHRRVLRNRRKRVPFLTPKRQGCEVWTLNDGRSPRVEALLEAWRIHAAAACQGNKSSEHSLSEFYCSMIRSLIENPIHIDALCEQRLLQIGATEDSATIHFPDEPELLASIRYMSNHAGEFQARLQRLREGLPKLTANNGKVVIFSASEVTADAIFEDLKNLRAVSVARHSIETEEDPSWKSFLTDSNIKAIVCGPSAEEGINLQGGEKVIVHFDLPFSPNRIEQRMGRVDRYGTGSPIRSIVILDEGSRLQQDWWELLYTGLNVFNRSIAALQYLIDEELQRLINGLLIDGTDSISALTEVLTGPDGKVAREFRLLDQQDALDELTAELDTQIVAVEEIDAEWKQTRAAMMYWIVNTLLFDKIPEREPGDARAQDPPFRFQYVNPNSGGAATLIHLSGFRRNFIGALDIEAPGSSYAQPRSHRYSVHRKTSINRGTRILRYGDGFVEAVRTFSEIDDRGRCFALWRHHSAYRGAAPTALYFRFDFLIETSIHEATSHLDEAGLHNSEAARAAMKRRGDALFAPTVVTVWTTDDGERVDPSLVESYLSQPYVRDAQQSAYVDTNLNPDRLRRLMIEMPDRFLGWSERCVRLRQLAERVLQEDVELLDRKVTATQKARRQNQIRLAQLAARSKGMAGAEAITEENNLELETRLSEALLRGIDRPLVRLDALGFVMLSAEPYLQ